LKGACAIAADAGFAGGGRPGHGSKRETVQVIMAAQARPALHGEWAGQGSNL
jgi:hypothetical protein